jgi:hypothetical protein
MAVLSQHGLQPRAEGPVAAALVHQEKAAGKANKKVLLTHRHDFHTIACCMAVAYASAALQYTRKFKKYL